jgi:lipid-binding SYLF domain-containing protein
VCVHTGVAAYRLMLIWVHFWVSWRENYGKGSLISFSLWKPMEIYRLATYGVGAEAAELVALIVAVINAEAARHEIAEKFALVLDAAVRVAAVGAAVVDGGAATGA